MRRCATYTNSPEKSITPEEWLQGISFFQCRAMQKPWTRQVRSIQNPEVKK